LITEETTRIGKRNIVTETRKIPVIRDHKVTNIVTAIHDITKSKTTEKELLSLNETFRKYNRKLSRLANVDSHTGLYNHRYMGKHWTPNF